MKARSLVRVAAIAAVYVVLCVVLAPISFGVIQFRLSEALCLLVVLCPEAVAGVTLGCFLANVLMSAPVDAVIGTLATLAAALASRRVRAWRFRGLALAASVPPILFNAVAVGGMLTVLYAGWQAPAATWAVNMLSVGAGQLVGCGVLGVALVWTIERSAPLRRLFGAEDG